jgi:glycosyltransferase involved in cell wall biosynthesis
VKTKVVIFSPALNAVSGVSTHVNMLFGSSLAQRYELVHFQVGREGRAEGKLQRLSRFVFSPFQLAVFLVRHRPRIVHINTSMNYKAFWRDMTYLIVARLLGCRVVNQFHSGSGPQKCFNNPLLAWSMKRFLLWSHVVVVLSAETLREHRGFDARIQVELVPNAIDTTGLLGVAHNVNLDGTLRLIFVGRLVHTKGLFEAIEAAKLLKAEGVRFSLRIAGSGPDEATLRGFIVKHGLEQEVELLGPIFQDAKNRLWLDSDVLVFPTYFEGLPYSLLEAMAAGCVPVICPVGGIPDVMRDGEHGLFVPVKDAGAVATAIRRLAEDRDELERMSQAGRRRIAEQYTVDRLAARFGEIYERVS